MVDITLANGHPGAAAGASPLCPLPDLKLGGPTVYHVESMPASIEPLQTPEGKVRC